MDYLLDFPPTRRAVLAPDLPLDANASPSLVHPPWESLFLTGVLLVAPNSTLPDRHHCFVVPDEHCSLLEPSMPCTTPSHTHGVLPTLSVAVSHAGPDCYQPFPSSASSRLLLITVDYC
jgi:hypothetical protein